LYPDWTSVESLRRALPPGAKPVAHWRTADAAFLAAAVAGKGVWSVVRLDGGETELRFEGRVHGAAGRALSSLDLEGRIVGSTAVLFGTEDRLTSSALSFDTGAHTAETLRFIVTAVAPGVWEIWRNGWLVDTGVPVRAGEAVLAFEGRPGSYFLRRL
jgi:hypothetical protein